MLVDIAVLAATGALSGVSQAAEVHELSSLTTSFVITADPSHQDPSGVTQLISNSSADRGATHALSPSLLPSLSGSALFDQFAVQPRSVLVDFVRSNASAVSALLANPPVASRVSSVWASLSPARQSTLASTVPQLVGNLEGVPFAIRDDANRRFLGDSVSTLTQRINAGVGRASLLNERHHLVVLQQVQRALVEKKGEPAHYLLSFDPAGEARAAVVVGDLSKADYVSYLVPGMFFTVQGQMFDWTVIASSLHQQQATWIKLLGESEPSMKGKTAAVVSWIGYSTPGILDIASLTKANSGAQFLGASIEGLRAARQSSEPYISLITHSYGSTTAMIELAKGAVSVDALAIVGSPGSAAQSASDLDVKNNNVFVGEAAMDPVVNTAFYGSDPGSAAFGAHRMNVSGGVDAITGKPLAAAVGHLGYFTVGSEAMRNFALISIGQGALVTDGTLADASRVPGSTASARAVASAGASPVRAAE